MDNRWEPPFWLLGLIVVALVLPSFWLRAKAQQPNVTAAPAYSGAPVNRATRNSSATITTGNTFQTVLASNFGTSIQRQALTIENNNTSDSCWIAFGKTAGGTVITAANATKAESILLQAGGAFTRYWPFVPSDEIEATCAANNDTLYIDNQ